VDPLDGLRSVRRRVTDPVESLAQAVADRIVELLVNALDVNALVQRIALDDVLGRVDVNQLLDRVNLDRLLERVDLNALAARIDIDALAEETDLGTIIAHSSSSVASGALDAVRSEAVTMDERVARWVRRLLRRRGGGEPSAPPRPAVLPGEDDHPSPPRRLPAA
jgi:hypothetical protein